MLLLNQVSGLVERGPERDIQSPLPYCARIYQKSLTVQQPTGLDLSALVAGHGLGPRWSSSKYQHKLAFIVHALIEGRHRDTRNDTPGNYVPLCSRWLQKFTQAADTAEALGVLQQVGVIEKHAGKYRVGHYPQKFRLTAEYIDRPLVSVELENATLAKRVARDREDRNALAVNGNAARAAVLENLASLSFAPGADALAASYEYRSPAQRGAWALSLADVKRGHLWLAADEDTGRIFHNATQCPRDLRPCSLIDGEETAEVDIRNAQPYFMQSLYPKNAAGAVAEERDHFRLVVTSGDFYEALFHGCTKKQYWGGERPGGWGFADEEGRGRFKKYTLEKIMYGVTAKGREAQVCGSFRSMFPFLASELALIRHDKAGTRELAKRLQKAEADLMLGRVVPRILRELPGCKPITLHDGILCQKRFGGEIQRIIQEEAKNIFGGSPPKIGEK